MRGEFVDIGGARLYCYAFGSRGAGIPIVLVHGSFTSSHLWQELLPRLPKGHRVLVLDLLGHGRSDRPADRPMTVAGHADRLLGLLNELSVSSACLVGHGLGAAVALRVAQLCPQKVAQLGLVNPSMLAAHASEVRIPGVFRRLSALVPVWKRLPPDWLASALHTALVRGYAQRSAGAHSVDFYLKPFRNREGRDAACAQLRALKLSSADTVSALAPASLLSPVSVVVGENDPFLQPQRAERVLHTLQVATESKAVVHRLTGVAHVAPEEAPDRLATIIGELLTQ
ncbi:MAG: alpha/beta hydrolase [Gemmatimonadaceae bacterium]